MDQGIKNEFKDNQTVLIGGISDAGFSSYWLKQLEESNVHGLTLIFIESNEEVADGDVARLIANGQVKNVICSHSGSLVDNMMDLKDLSKEEAEKFLSDNINIQIYPMDILCQKIQAGANNIKGIVVDKKLIEPIGLENKHMINVGNNKDYVFEPAIHADIGLIKADTYDEYGNVQWKSTEFDSMDIAKASKKVYVETDHKVKPDPNYYQLEYIWNNMIYDNSEDKVITKAQFKSIYETNNKDDIEELDDSKLKERIAKKALEYIPEDSVVNLGYGIPTFFMIPGVAHKATLEMESNVLGVSEVNNETGTYADPGGQLVNLAKGGVVSKTVNDSFELINNHKIDMTVLGAFEVSKKGDLANWATNESKAGIGGAVALALNSKSVMVTMIEHLRNGKSKIVDKLDLPFTAKGVVDYVVTNEHVYKLINGELQIIEEYKDDGWHKVNIGE